MFSDQYIFFERVDLTFVLLYVYCVLRRMGGIFLLCIEETFDKDSRHGYLLEVDISYPKELHDHHIDLPFMCEKIQANGVEELVPNLYNKEKYVIHIKALKQVLDHGLVLKKIHRVIEFKQSAWMKEYIDFNTRLRTAAKNDF